MDTFLRTIAIIIEVMLLVIIAYSILNGFRLTVFDLGIKSKYGKAVVMAFVVVGCLILVFFTAHLAAWYPAIK